MPYRKSSDLLGMKVVVKKYFFNDDEIIAEKEVVAEIRRSNGYVDFIPREDVMYSIPVEVLEEVLK